MKKTIYKAKQTIKNENVKQIAIVVISLLLSVIVGLIPQWAGVSSFTIADQFTLGILTFGTLLMIDLVWMTYVYTKLKKGDVQHWELRNDTETDIANIRANFHQIHHEAYGKKDLFVSHFKHEIKTLLKKIKEVAEKKELFVSANHFLTVENVVHAFEGDSEKIWRYTWPIDTGDEQMFDILHWKQYFEVTIKMLNEGKINKIQCILILKQQNIIDLPRIKKLLDFFKMTNSMECRITTYDKFQNICDSDGFSINSQEFGLYSSQLLYINEQYEPIIKGTFTKDESTIELYRKLFNTMWSLDAVTQENPSTNATKISFKELFDFDATTVPPAQ
ncbi:hypothetical protein JYU20_04870 [Bacteroidales bacterium AH-315-I05]|nr:hypothetical protein [Bacteroidales bacterium AH-315-I05]